MTGVKTKFISENGLIKLLELMTIEINNKLVGKDSDGNIFPMSTDISSLGGENSVWGSVYANSLYGGTSGLEIVGDATIDGTTTIVGTTTIDGNVIIEGVATLNNGASINGNTTIYGDVYANAFYQTSDENLKDFSNDINVDFAKLKEIRKSYFTWKDDEEGTLQIGTSAQDIQKVYPELVSEDNSGHLTVDYARLSLVALSAIDKLDERISKIENALNINIS